MPKLTFSGARIRHFDVRDKEGGVFCRVHFTSDYSRTVCNTMGWPEDLPENTNSAKLEGRLSASGFVLTPNGNEELKTKHQIELGCNDVSDFQVFRVQKGDGESYSTELRFVVRSDAKWAESHLGKYLRAIRQERGSLKVDYIEQTELDDDTAEPATEAEADLVEA